VTVVVGIVRLSASGRALYQDVASR